MTFREMNKVMNNFKNQGNSIVIQSVNENVIPHFLKLILKRPSQDGLFFMWKLIMSKRYSGKSFKDSSVKKKPKLSFKEKRKVKKDKQKKTN